MSKERMRTLRDEQGQSWRVWHVVPESSVLRVANPSMASGWLCFEREGGEKRRLAGPPEGWERLTDAQLLRLLADARPVRVRAKDGV